MKRCLSVAMLAAVTLLGCARTGQDVIEDAAEAMGGAEVISAAATLVMEGTGTTYRLGQNPSPEADLPTYELHSYRKEVDLDNSRWRTEQIRTGHFLTSNPVDRQSRVEAVDGDVAFNVQASGAAQRLAAQGRKGPPRRSVSSSARPSQSCAPGPPRGHGRPAARGSRIRGSGRHTGGRPASHPPCGRHHRPAHAGRIHGVQPDARGRGHRHLVRRMGAVRRTPSSGHDLPDAGQVPERRLLRQQPGERGDPRPVGTGRGGVGSRSCAPAGRGHGRRAGPRGLESGRWL